MNYSIAKKITLRYILILSLTTFFGERTIAQTLTVSTSNLNFGNAYENAPDSLQLTIFNNLNHAVQVTGIKFYATYSSPAFSVNTDYFNIPSLLSQSVWVKFSPFHNIFHNSEMVIENDAQRGFVSVDLKGQGKFSNTYYNATENLDEENLKTAIHVITGVGYDTLGYNISRDSMFMWLDNQRTNGQGASQNTLEGIYTGTLATGYVNRTACQTTFSFNTEHTFPQGFFSSAEPMKSDLHHLFPTDDASNNYRANNPFGVVASPTWTVGGSKGTTTLFEPRDQQKGATARAMMYFVLRYQDFTNFFAPQESILRTWHHTFPPTQIEKKRNDDINTVQHNRNPFVDYPQLIERIHSISTFSTAPVSASIDLTEDTIIYGYVQTGASNIFHYIIVNNGNADVHFTNFSLSNPGVLSFQSGGNDTAIAAGDALGININLVTVNQGSIHGMLSFNTDDPANNSVSIPVYANDSLVSSIYELNQENISVFPNPVEKLMVIHYQLSDDADLKILDVAGKDVLSTNLPKNTSSETIDVSILSSGMYFLKLETGKKIIFQKFVKQ